MTDPIILRPVEEADLEPLRRLDTDPEASRPFEWTGYRSPNLRRRRWEEDGLLGRETSLLVTALPDGTVAGVVSWQAVMFGTEGGCVEIGCLLFPEHRGRGLGTAAQRQLAAHLFETTPVNRLQAVTEVENVAEQRVLERIGFRREGVLRGCAFVRGAWQDAAMYARLRGDPA